MIKLPEDKNKIKSQDLVAGDIALISSDGERHIVYMTDFSEGRRLFSLTAQKKWHPAGFIGMDVIKVYKSGDKLEIA